MKLLDNQKNLQQYLLEREEKFKFRKKNTNHKSKRHFN